MTKNFKIVAAAMAIAMTTFTAAPVSATSLTVQLACATDYYAYCSKHDTEGPGVRACMRANGERLSKRCINALVAAGEVSKAEVDRRSSSSSTAAK